MAMRRIRTKYLYMMITQQATKTLKERRNGANKYEKQQMERDEELERRQYQAKVGQRLVTKLITQG